MLFYFNQFNQFNRFYEKIVDIGTLNQHTPVSGHPIYLYVFAAHRQSLWQEHHHIFYRQVFFVY